MEQITVDTRILRLIMSSEQKPVSSFTEENIEYIRDELKRREKNDGDNTIQIEFTYNENGLIVWFSIIITFNQLLIDIIVDDDDHTCKKLCESSNDSPPKIEVIIRTEFPELFPGTWNISDLETHADADNCRTTFKITVYVCRDESGEIIGIGLKGEAYGSRTTTPVDVIWMLPQDTEKMRTHFYFRTLMGSKKFSSIINSSPTLSILKVEEVF